MSSSRSLLEFYLICVIFLLTSTAIVTAIEFVNVATSGTASQSSNLDGFSLANRAIDGNTNSAWSGNSCSHTNNDLNAWWKVDLGASYPVYEVIVTNRHDCCGDRLLSAEVRVGDSMTLSENTRCGEVVSADRVNDETLIFQCDGLVTGRYVSIQITDGAVYLHVCEVQVMVPQPIDGTTISMETTTATFTTEQTTEDHTTGTTPESTTIESSTFESSTLSQTTEESTTEVIPSTMSLIQCVDDPCSGPNELCVDRETGYECICRSGYARKDSGNPCNAATSFKGQFVINEFNGVEQNFTEEVNDPTQDIYKDLEDAIRELFDTIFEDDPEYIKTYVLGFREGSVIAEYVNTFNATTSYNNTSLQSQIEANTGTYTNITLTDIIIVDYNDLVCLRPSGHDCSDNAQCLDQPDGTFTCLCECGYGDGSVDRPGRNCSQESNTFECLNGICYVVAGVKTCECRRDYRGDNCDIHIPTSEDFTTLQIIAITAGVTCGIMFIALLFAAYAYICIYSPRPQQIHYIPFDGTHRNRIHSKHRTLTTERTEGGNGKGLYNEMYETYRREERLKGVTPKTPIFETTQMDDVHNEPDTLYRGGFDVPYIADGSEAARLWDRRRNRQSEKHGHRNSQLQKTHPVDALY